MYPEVDGTDDATERALAARASEDRAVYLGLFSAADQRGHLHGPASTETAGACAELDWRLRRLRRVFHRAGKDPVWLVIGDHGMLEVTRRVDVLGVLRGAARRAGLVEGRDWVAFCDSTAVRIWFLTEKAAAPLASALEALADFGSVATQEIARARRIPFGDRSQGDLLWLAEPGVLVCPDYFHRRDETILGMHGYDPQVDGQKGFAVLGGPGVGRVTIPEGHLVDGCATLCDLLGLVPPSSCEGTSWVGRVVEA
jgi:predicted AlkP superfamily pyrophosphatase or phosphodiesterase